MTSISRVSYSMRSNGSSPANNRVFFFVALLLLVTGCEREQLHHRQLIAFGTIVSLQFSGVDADAADQATTALETEYRRLEIDWYPWARDSSGELVRLNAAIRDGRPFELSEQLQTLIVRAAEIEIASEGRFNAATGALTRAWGLHDLENPPTSKPDSSLLQSLVNSNLTLENLADTNRNPLIEVDLGGIAKGAVLRLSAEKLRVLGIGNAIVDLGGDLIVLGRIGDRSAVIGIRGPDTDRALATLDVEDGEAVMTSGDYERFIEFDGKRYPHIIDPRNGQPVLHASSATVVHADPLLADAAATALIVGGIDEFDDVCRALGLKYAMLTSATGDQRLTSGMAERVEWTRQ